MGRVENPLNPVNLVYGCPHTQFTHPLHIIKFVVHTVGKNENFALTQMSQNPQKLAQISYF